MQQTYYFKKTTRLSNYYICKISFGGFIYTSAEAAFHAQKFEDDNIKHLMTKLTPDESKKVNRALSRFLRKDWEQVKYEIMKMILICKYTQNADCRKELLATGDMILVEDTTGWHDNIWGNCNCPKCQNILSKQMLGSILMEIRKEMNT